MKPYFEKMTEFGKAMTDGQVKKSEENVKQIKEEFRPRRMDISNRSRAHSGNHPASDWDLCKERPVYNICYGWKNIPASF